MTVADNTSRNQYTATSGQTVFAYTFEIVDKDDIVVLKNGTTLSEGTNYTVSNVGNDSGGNVTLTVGATAGDILTLYRDMPYARTQNYTNSGDFLASEVNSDFDNLWLAGEQTNRSFSQSIRKPITDSDSISMELPEAADRTDSFLTFDSTGAVSTSPLAGANAPTTTTRQQFTGDGSTTVFTLAADPGSPAAVVIYIDGVYQEEGTYSISGSTLTFTEAPPTNASIEAVLYRVTDIGTTDANSVTYLPAGTGAVQTTVQTKLRESVSVKDFGAVGDGVTDDTAAINLAISHVASSGGVLYAPAGEYIYTDVPEVKYPVYGGGVITRASGKREWWAFPRIGVVENIETTTTMIDKWRELVVQSVESKVDDLTYICVGDSTRASYGTHIFKYLREQMTQLNIDTILAAKSGQSADDWGNATGSDRKWNDLIGANAYTWDAIPGTGATTLIDICLGINDTSNVGGDTIDQIKTNIKAGIDNLISNKADVMINLTSPNRLRNQPAKTSKLTQVYYELSRENNWPMFDMVENTLPTASDAVSRSDLYTDDTHPNESGQLKMAQGLLEYLVPAKDHGYVIDSPKLMADPSDPNASAVEDAFEFIYAAYDNGWTHLRLWKFDANTYYFSLATSASAISQNFKPNVQNAFFPADYSTGVYVLYDVSPSAGGGTWTRTRRFCFKIKDIAPLDALPNGTLINLSPAIRKPYTDLTTSQNTYKKAGEISTPKEFCSIYFDGSPTGFQTIVRKVAIENSVLGLSYRGSYAEAGTAATGNTTFNIRRNGTQIGAVTFAAGSTNGTFSSAPSYARETISGGDVFDIIAPSPADATLADITFTIFSDSDKV